MSETVFWLWLTVCPDFTMTGRCATERHICHWRLCLELIDERKPTSAIWRPVE